MSAPTPAHGDDRPREGYYPDPSIPGYVRYWNGTSWVPGTSRPAPADGAPLTPPSDAGPAAGPVEETGPHFFDEDPPAQGPDWGTHEDTFLSRRPTPGPAAPAHQDPGTMTFRRVSGPAATPAAPEAAAGRPAGTPAPQEGPAPAAGAKQQGDVPGARGPADADAGFGRVAAHAPFGHAPQLAEAQRGRQPDPAAPAPAPQAPAPGGGQSSWAQQVHRLAGTGEEQPVAPWKPVVEDPFTAAARRQAAARPAGLGRRFAARLIDNLFVGAVTAAAAVPLGVRAADHIRHKVEAARLSGRTVTVWLLDGTTVTYLGVVLAVLLVFGLAYEVLPTAKWGRTLGKKLCGLQVRDIEGHEPPPFGAALRRWLVYSLSGLLGIGIVGVLWCVFDRPWRQCWHDKAAHTFVAG